MGNDSIIGQFFQNLSRNLMTYAHFYEDSSNVYEDIQFIE